MSDWPDGIDVGPIREWPGALTPASKRRESPFESTAKTTGTDGVTRSKRAEVPLGVTLKLLDRELAMLVAKEREVLIAIPAGQFRQDGRPYANAKAEHPGVILSFTSRVGRLSYPCDTFMTWQANLRAIALALEALRKVDRYGVTSHGEQYRGFLALEAPNAEATTVERARLFLVGLLGPLSAQWYSDDELIRKAKRQAHPDTGGDADTFYRVLDAERTLREAGAL